MRYPSITLVGWLQSMAGILPTILTGLESSQSQPFLSPQAFPAITFISRRRRRKETLHIDTNKNKKKKLSNIKNKKMRREGWQHGAVRIKTTTGPADADAELAPFSVAKPTNHSKFTGKCRRARCAACHSHPVSKSRDKAKGAHKLRSCDVALNHRLVSWRVTAAAAEDVGCAHWSKYSGSSATGVLDQLTSERDYYREDEDDDEECRSMDESYGDDVVAECGDVKEEEDEEDDVDVDGEFCKVGIVWEYVDGEDWCLVHEMV